MGCAGDVPTMETLAAVDLLRGFFPDLKIRVVNVVDLMRLQDDREHPHGLSNADFDSLFTRDKPVIFAYHGYPWLIHRLTYRRTNHENVHVRGYKEEGTTTTPFDMCVMNQIDRFNLAMDVIDRVQRLQATSGCGAGDAEEQAHRAPALRPCARRGHARDPGLAVDAGDGPTVVTPARPAPPRRPSVRVLVVNAGSSSLKLAVLDDERTGLATTVEAGRGEAHLEPLREFLDEAGPSTPSGTAWSTAVRASPSRCVVDDEVRGLPPLHRRPGSPAQPTRGRGHPRRTRR